MQPPKSTPFWLFPALAAGMALVAVVLGVLTWRKFNAPLTPQGQDIPVRPGMYNLQQELQKPRPPQPQ